FLFFRSDVRIYADRDFGVGLMVLVAGGGCRPKCTRILVRRIRRGYTQEKNQAFENKRHLFPLPLPSGVWAALRVIVFRRARSAKPLLLAFAPGALRISTALF